MGRLKKLEARIAQLEKDAIVLKNLTLQCDTPINQLVSAQTSTGIPIKSGPTQGGIDFAAGKIILR